jgi:hypothetical protein
MGEPTYTDTCGHVIDRNAAVREATRVILSQGDAYFIVREHVEQMTDDELMEWLVYPDTGEFDDYLHRALTEGAET